MYIIFYVFRNEIKAEKKKKKDKKNSKEQKKDKKEVGKADRGPVRESLGIRSPETIKREIKEKLENMKDRNSPEGI